MVALWLIKFIFVKRDICRVEIINLVFGQVRPCECGNICSIRQYISHSKVDWVPVFVMCLVSEPVRLHTHLI